jgi:KDO2-lipid IV(A) lauroyltransferase
MALKGNKYLDPIIYGFLYGLVRFLSLIPFHTGQRFGRTFGRGLAKVFGGRIKVSLDNLRHVYGSGMSESELRELNTKVVMHFAQMIFEAPHILRLKHTNLEKYVVFENKEIFLSAMEKGRGVFLLTAHFGNWELMSAAASLKFAHKGAVIARPIDFLPAERLINQLRSRFGNKIIPKQRAMRRVLKAAKENVAIGFLMDQNVDWYEGVFVQFLGRPACTNKGLALLALRTGTPVIPMFSVRQEDGRYRIIFGREVELVRTGDKTRDLEENTQLFCEIIERYVRRYPDQWFWFHRRWKTRPYCQLPEDYYSTSMQRAVRE